MNQPFNALNAYCYLAQRDSSGYRELFICGTNLRAQSLVSDMENEGRGPEETAAVYHLPLEAVLEAVEYVHANEEFVAAE